MMRTECMPHLQEKLDTDLRNRLRTLLTFTLLVLIATGATFCALIFTGTRGVELPRLISADGQTQISWAIPVTPSLVICEGEPPVGVQLSVRGNDRIPITEVRTSAIPSGAKITLFRTDAPMTDQPIPVISGAESGQRALAVGPNQEKWEGVLIERKAPVFEAQPAITLPSGLPVYTFTDKSMVGIIIQNPEGSMVVSMSAIVALFPELKSGQ